MKKLLSLAFAFAMAVALAAQGNGNGNGNNGNGNNGNGNVGNGNGNSEFLYTAWAEYPEKVLVGQEGVCIDVYVRNDNGRAIPDVTAWVDGMAWILGYDAKGKAIMSESISKKGDVFSICVPVDTSNAGELEFNIEIWTRLGNKNWQELIFGGPGNTIKIEVVEPEPEIPTFPDGIELDKDGNLVITLVAVLPQSNGQNWIDIWVDGRLLRAGGQGGAEFNTNSKSIKIQSSALAAGIVTIEVGTKRPNVEGYLEFELIVENGVPVGAVIL